VETRTAVVLDPEPLWCDAVAGVLTRLEIRVVGLATSAGTARAAIGKAQPDLLVSEISLGAGVDGLAFLAEAQRAKPGLRCVVLSDVNVPERRLSAFRAGARAYVVKTAEPEELASAVRQAFRRSIYFPPPYEEVEAGQAEDPKHDLLTRRELEILELVAAGGQSAQIASRLWVTEQTVKFHLSNIYRKLGVANRTEASRWAFEHGILAGEEPRTSPPLPPDGGVIRSTSDDAPPVAPTRPQRQGRVNLRTRGVRTPDSR
jgi:DNA-binding NarL/FixJ family response regulator